MVTDELKSYLNLTGFTIVRVNAGDIYLFEKAIGTDGNILAILLFDFERNSFLKQQFLAVRNKVEQIYYERGFTQVELISILCGTGEQEMKDCCVSCDYSWILDSDSRRFLLFENQSEGFDEFRSEIERYLEGILPERGSGSYNRRKSMLFSPINTGMVVINVIIFLITDFILRKEDGNLLEYGALYWPLITENGQFYRLFTYMFLHSGVDHILNNMLVLFFIGDNLERTVGKWKYLSIYLLSGFLAGLASMGYNMFQGETPFCVGASGAIFGVCGAVAYLVIVNKGRLEDLSKRQIILFVLLSLYGGLTSKGVDNAAHIGGLIAGVILAAILYRRPKVPVYRQEETNI